ncbi:helix-turn-helix domain-containing protein [Cobetia amphilecti]|uniref:XRE family transcriptional regulator n=1 Tax=Cobetia amphilecti TaxID=1055104 RepID=A0AAP4TWS4_9GAMM|nr:XRE family transcriptional regulator [Cobetia amphilecti]MBU3008707.1 XRE family transcriptional regulator [Cobetia amphilecti]MDO6671719.1 XRE family transcriptional regulator [Cobetia amphilecti]
MPRESSHSSDTPQPTAPDTKAPDTKAPSLAAEPAAQSEVKETITAAADETRLGLEQHIARALKQQRVSQGYKISDVSRIAGVSQGMISKVENAQVSTSLDTLNKLCNALSLPISKLFSDYDVNGRGAQHIKAGQGMQVVRTGTEVGHAYQLLSYKQGPKKRYEPFLITMDDASEVFPNFCHAGHEFIYLLSGNLTYRHGDKFYDMGPGDSLAFDAGVPHGPEKLNEVPIQLLSIIHYDDE